VGLTCFGAGDGIRTRNN